MDNLHQIIKNETTKQFSFKEHIVFQPIGFFFARMHFHLPQSAITTSDRLQANGNNEINRNSVQRLSKQQTFDWQKNLSIHKI